MDRICFSSKIIHKGPPIDADTVRHVKWISTDSARKNMRVEGELEVMDGVGLDTEQEWIWIGVRASHLISAQHNGACANCPQHACCALHELIK